MADNYIERKMEEHCRGSAPFKRKLTPAGQRPGKVLIDFPPINAYVIDGASGYGALAVKTLCDAGCRVAFCAVDAKLGAATAQRCGAQFHPVASITPSAIIASMDRVENQWGPIGLIVDCGSDAAILQSCRDNARILRLVADSCVNSSSIGNANTIVLPSEGIDDRGVSTLILLLSSPAAHSIKGQTFRL